MEIISGLWFYVVYSLFGVVGYGLTIRIFSNNLTAYLSAKIVGLILFGYLIWLSASVHVLNFQNHGTVTLLFALACGASLWSVYQYRTEQQEEHKTADKKPRAQKSWFERIIFWELMSLALYALYLYLRSHNAAINGTERFMDMAFLVASGKTEFFPPIDPWYAGKTINYYYFGSYLMSLVTNLSQLPYSFGYTAALGLIFSQSFILSAGLVYSTIKSKAASLWTGFMLTAAGTIYFAGCSLKGALAGLSPVCSYASSTRLYTPSYIINEIPSYSFTVGDLHAHLLALPLFLCLLYIVFAVCKNRTLTPSTFLVASVGGAVLAMTNAWDAVTYFSLLLVLLTVHLYTMYRQTEPMRARIRLSMQYVSIIVASLILTIPFSIHFQSPVLGIGIAPLYAKAHQLMNIQYPTPLLALLGMWGALILISILSYRAQKKITVSVFALTLATVSAGIIIGVEIFFIKDIYSIANPPYFRANTTFKFGYHAWSMLTILAGLLTGGLLIRASSAHKRSLRTAVFATMLLIAGAGLVYPYQAIKQFYGYSTSQTLDGSTWIAQTHPDDYATIQYINNTISGRPVIIEAVG
ncbi:MAG: hypothetical protein KBD66_01070, partial [Candidatus Doudnabacteria bacterium]|nr:hypothetical protein [Candidatus Doudnabacteria bacterium]